jgi:hypothetical protein
MQPISDYYNDGHCASWIFYGSDKNSIIKTQKEVDHIFHDYSFYPEIEWGTYGYRAPEGHQVLGAWRHPETRAFAFLLDNPSMVTIREYEQLLDDLHDLTVIAERHDEYPVSLDEMKKRLADHASV